MPIVVSWDIPINSIHLNFLYSYTLGLYILLLAESPSVKHRHLTTCNGNLEESTRLLIYFLNFQGVSGILMLTFLRYRALISLHSMNWYLWVCVCVWLCDYSCHECHLLLSHTACWSPFMLTPSVRSLQFGSTAHSKQMHQKTMRTPAH